MTGYQAQGRGPVTALQPHGDMDASNHRGLIAKAGDVCDPGPRDILLDLSGTLHTAQGEPVASIYIRIRRQE